MSLTSPVRHTNRISGTNPPPFGGNFRTFIERRGADFWRSPAVRRHPLVGAGTAPSRRGAWLLFCDRYKLLECRSRSAPSAWRRLQCRSREASRGIPAIVERSRSWLPRTGGNPLGYTASRQGQNEVSSTRRRLAWVPCLP